MSYTINFVNTVLVTLKQEIDRFHESVNGVHLDQPSIRSYLRWIKERDQHLKLLEMDILERENLTEQDLAGRLHDVVTDIIMIQGPVESFRRIVRREYGENELYRGLYSSLDNYHSALQSSEDAIEEWREHHKSQQY